MNNLEKNKEIKHHYKIKYRLLQCKILLWQGKLNELVKMGEETRSKFKGQDINLYLLDNLLLMIHALLYLENFDKAFNLIRKVEELIKLLPTQLSKAHKQREAYLSLMKGIYYGKSRKSNYGELAIEYIEQSLNLREELGNQHEISESLSSLSYTVALYKGKIDRALKYAERSLTLAKESRKKYYIATSFHIMAIVFNFQGEIDRSITAYEQSLMIFKILNNKDKIADVLNNMADSYRMKGELDYALKSIKQALVLNRELGKVKVIAYNHDVLIQILIEKGDFKQANNYLKDLKQLSNKLNDKRVDWLYVLDKALVLKTSNQDIKRGKSEEILKHLIKDESLDYENTYRVLLNLCELLLIKLSSTNKLKTLDELKDYVNQIMDIASKMQSSWLLAATNLLQAKLALLTLNFNEAEKSLIKAHQISEKHGLKQLIDKISMEQVEMLKLAKNWTSLEYSTEKVIQDLKLVPLKDQINYMLKKRQFLKKIDN